MSESHAPSEAPVSVVGIGASAGGLEVIQKLLKKLPDNTGMAFVIIQHLSPDYKSMLSEILCKYTMMPVLQAENGQTLERNTIYLIPPKFNMEVKQGKLLLHAYVHTRIINHPIDIFLRSLAHEYETRAVAVILSGTGSDGTNGIRAIKEQGGVILVQRPETAKFDGMPRSALQTGFADMSLSPEEIADELTHIAETVATEPIGMTNEELLNKIYSILKRASSVNYTYYKQTTITRRGQRPVRREYHRGCERPAFEPFLFKEKQQLSRLAGIAQDGGLRPAKRVSGSALRQAGSYLLPQYDDLFSGEPAKGSLRYFPHGPPGRGIPVFRAQ